ncbi:MAG: response regulator [Blastocatellia bacterium]|nr:response regulator [Blastocatellia bacterium]
MPHTFPLPQTNSTHIPPLGKLLIADDNKLNCMVLSQVFRKEGYEVRTVENGKQALDLLLAEPFDVLLLDLMMPELDGFQVLEIIKSRTEFLHLPVIMISSLDETGSVVRCIEMGADDYLTRPYDPALLKARVWNCLEKKRLHDTLTETLGKIVKQKEDIEEKNRQILDSIHYANRIQNAMLPQGPLLETLLGDYFLVFQPKDIVSGDFYWVYVTHADQVTRVFLVVADCTGHGVPGAFMSMIGNTLLNQIIGEKNIYDPAQILELLHAGVQTILGQTNGGTGTNDGMDIGLVCIEGYRLTFAGARRPLLVLKPMPEGAPMLEEVKGDRKTVGGVKKNEIRKFTNCVIEFSEGTVLFLSTDGFADQCNEQGERFGSKRLRSLLSKISDKPLARQKTPLLDELHQFQGIEPQRDDITLLAVRLPLPLSDWSQHVTGSFSMIWDINL